MSSSDIPRSEVERVLDELRRDANWHHTTYRQALHDAADRLAALLKPKQYQVEYWVGVRADGSQCYFSKERPRSDWSYYGLVAVRYYTDTLEHGEGIE